MMIKNILTVATLSFCLNSTAHATGTPMFSFGGTHSVRTLQIKTFQQHCDERLATILNDEGATNLARLTQWNIDTTDENLKILAELQLPPHRGSVGMQLEDVTKDHMTCGISHHTSSKESQSDDDDN